MTPAFTRKQYIMADNAVNAIIEASVNGVTTREAFSMFYDAAEVAGVKYDAKYGNVGGWRTRMLKNFNSSNDEELGK